MDLTDLAMVVWVPLAGGAIVLALYLAGAWAGRRADRFRRSVTLASRAVAVVIAAWTFVEALVLYGAARSGGGAWQSAGGVEMGPIRLVLAFRVDGLSGLVVLAAAGIALAVLVYSLRAMAGHPREAVFYGYALWTLAAVSAAALAGTLVVLIVAWEVATVLLYLLVGMGRAGARAAAMKTFTILGLADVGLLLGVAILAGTGAVGRDLLMAPGAAGPASTGTGVLAAAYLLMAGAALAKAGAMPLHTWIPDAGEEAPTPVFALLPAALDKLLGIYLLARVTFGLFATSSALATVLMVVGAATILCAVMMAMVQHNLKRLLAFHAVSQVGYMVLGMGLAAWVLAEGRAAGGPTPAQAAVATIAFAGGLFHMLNHAIYKCTLFLTAGSVERATGTSELDRLGGLARVLPVTFASAAVAALAISGVPPMNGFVSKWLVYNGALGAGSGLATACLVVAVFGSALTLASFVKVIHSVFLGTRGAAVPAGDAPRESWVMAVPMAVLAAACIVLGIGGGWAVRALILPAAAGAGIEPAGVEAAGGAIALAGGRGLWEPGLATLLVVCGALVGLALYAVGRAMRVRVVPNFVGGEDDSSDELWHVSGTHFYETVRRLPLIGAALGDASDGAFDVYRLGGRYGAVVVERLRAWHTGLLASYASWVIVGLVVLVLLVVL